MGNCACAKDSHVDEGRRKGDRSKLNRKQNKDPEILGEAIAPPDLYDEEPGVPSPTSGSNPIECENLLRPNKKISLTDFELMKVIGRGSFGKVYLVKRAGTENYFALKKLRKDVVAQRNLFIKTQAERDILEKIDSPFIVKLHYAF